MEKKTDGKKLLPDLRRMLIEIKKTKTLEINQIHLIYQIYASSKLLPIC